MPTELVLLRHGQTEWNVTHRIQGSVDIPLNDLGMEQARAAGEALASASLDAIVSSQLERAIATARLVNGAHGVPHSIDERLAERAHGRFEGLTVQEIIDEIGAEQVDDFFQHSPELESWHSVAERVLRALNEAAVANEGRTTLIVSHGGAIKAAVAAIRGVHHRSLPGLHNCSFTRLAFDGTWTISDYNDIRHLPESLRT